MLNLNNRRFAASFLFFIFLTQAQPERVGRVLLPPLRDGCAFLLDKSLAIVSGALLLCKRVQPWQEIRQKKLVRRMWPFSFFCHFQPSISPPILGRRKQHRTVACSPADTRQGIGARLRLHDAWLGSTPLLFEPLIFFVTNCSFASCLYSFSKMTATHVILL